MTGIALCLGLLSHDPGWQSVREGNVPIIMGSVMLILGARYAGRKLRKAAP
ncbi:MAG: hypothetical protein Q8N44_14245 [Rubrivivax sp.]|nr:hypothetical protein [Rubrivivax sp.]